MESARPSTLPKEERLSGKTSVSKLVGSGKWGTARDFRYCFSCGNGTAGADGAPYNRIMVSVPKKLFKRAVKRNLLKRRVREAYRTRKGMLEVSGVDLLLTYNSAEVQEFGRICEDVEAVLTEVSRRALASGSPAASEK